MFNELLTQKLQSGLSSNRQLMKLTQSKDAMPTSSALITPTYPTYRPSLSEFLCEKRNFQLNFPLLGVCCRHHSVHSP